MIKLTKGPEPEILAKNSANWTTLLLNKLAAGEVPTNAEKSHYRHRSVKEALEKETNGKCAYCESKLKHIHHGDVEHIFPKSLEPSKQFEWLNLTLACEICNQNKSNRDPTVEHIVDPYIDEPSTHIGFVGAFALALGSQKGASSIAILDLNRVHLVEMRNETVKRITGVLEVVFREDLPLAAKRAILEDFRKTETTASAQYSSLVNNVLAAVEPRLPPELAA